jgi:hypothetical protein
MAHFLRNISGFRKEEIDAFLASFDTVLTDCDGKTIVYVLHVYTQNKHELYLVGYGTF